MRIILDHQSITELEQMRAAGTPLRSRAEVLALVDAANSQGWPLDANYILYRADSSPYMSTLSRLLNCRLLNSYTGEE